MSMQQRFSSCPIRYQPCTQYTTSSYSPIQKPKDDKSVEKYHRKCDRNILSCTSPSALGSISVVHPKVREDKKVSRVEPKHGEQHSVVKRPQMEIIPVIGEEQGTAQAPDSASDVEVCAPSGGLKKGEVCWAALGSRNGQPTAGRMRELPIYCLSNRSHPLAD